MTADDDLKSRRFCIQVESLEIMKNVDGDWPGLRYGGFRQRFCPFSGVDIAADRDEWSNSPKRDQYFGMTNVAGMNDQIGAAQSLQRLMA